MSERNELMRYRLDASVQRLGSVVIGGSPLKLFRLTAEGVALVDRLAGGTAVRRSRLVDALLAAGAIHPDPDSPGPFTESDVTVVMPAYVRAPESVLHSIVVDDGSPAPIPGAALRLAVNRGPGAARNAGTTLVTTALVAYVDTDVELPDGWLQQLLPHFADPLVALVAPRVRSRPGRSRIARYERDHSPLDLGDQPARVRAGTRVSYVPAAAIVCRLDALHSVGGFDESLRVGEDVDLVWRLDEAGWTCRYEPASIVSHEPRADWRAWIAQRVGYGSSSAPLSRRHPGALAPIRMSGWSVLAWFLAAAGRPIAGATVGLGTAAALVRKLPDVPPKAAFDLAARGNLRAGEQLAGAIRRIWWPVLILAAIRWRRARLVLLASIVSARSPLRLADDVAFSAGVWRGIWSERTLAPLIPEISSWPGRQAAAPPDSQATDASGR